MEQDSGGVTRQKKGTKKADQKFASGINNRVEDDGNNTDPSPVSALAPWQQLLELTKLISSEWNGALLTSERLNTQTQV